MDPDPGGQYTCGSGSPTQYWFFVQVKRQLKEVKRTEDRVWENASVKEVCVRIARFLDREELDKAYSLLLR